MRGIHSAENLVAGVEGDISEVGETMKITEIRLKYALKIPPGTRDKVERVLNAYAEKCPAYQSVKDSIKCTWEADIKETQ